MKDTNQSDNWRVLCELASKEKDPEKLIDLIVKINQALRSTITNLALVTTTRTSTVLLR
jgi:hypothetical protein